jgi:outer membrane lipoprotein-sorting protein
MSKISGLFLSAGGLLLINSFMVSAAQAQDAKTVITKTNAVYKNLKSLQASFETSITAAGKGNGIMQTDIKVIPGQKANINVHPIGKGSGVVGTQLAGGTMHIVDDGSATYMYIAQKNQYMKGPHNPNAFQGVTAQYGLPYAGMTVSPSEYKLLAPSTVDGKPVFVLEYIPAKAAGKIKIDIAIDKATYRIKQSKIIQPSGSLSTLVKNEVLNAPLSASLFTFTPPKGATEFKPPLQNPGAPR